MKVKTEINALRQQAGYTLIELSIAVAIIAVLVMTGLYGVPKILATNNVTTLTQQVALASANYSKVAAQTGGSAKTFADNTSAANVKALGQMGIWADETLVKDSSNVVTKIVNPFGGQILSKSISSTNALSNMAADEGVWIKLEGIPQSQCFSVGSAFINQAVGLWVDSAQSAAGAYTYTEPTSTNVGGTTSPKVNGAVDLSKLASLCTTAGTAATAGKPVSVYLLFAY